MTIDLPWFAPLGDSAITATFGTEISAELSERIRQAADRLRRANLPTVQDLVPAYTTLTVYYDPLHIGFAELAGRLRPLLDAPVLPDALSTWREVRIPVRYDGPDLNEVARLSGLSPFEVVERHSSRWYRVYLLGFVPGFAYLGDLDPRLVLPRRGAPRKVVPAGSVAIAGAQTGVYPLNTPGGWHLIGRTNTVLFDPELSEPALLRVGDRVRFDAVDA